MAKIYIISALVFSIGLTTALILNQKNNNEGLGSDPDERISTTNVKSIASSEYKIEEVLNNLYVPWSIVFTSNERFLFSQRNGEIYSFENGNKKLLYRFEEVLEQGEEGLMGIEKHFNYNLNKYIYACVSYKGDNKNKIVRLIDNNESLKVDKIIIDNIPSATNHAGCRIKFGPDNKLYITTGDATNKNLAQDLNSLAGKILRLNDDGTIPNDNPYNKSPIWSYGHRNPQGITWDKNGKMYSTEHGPSGNDGPRGGDEINIIEKGKNYGWPTISYNKEQKEMVKPILLFEKSVAPASALIYKIEKLQKFKDKLLFGGLVGSDIYIVDLNNFNYEKMNLGLGRIRDIVEAPNGDIYFSTSNKDGRGNPKQNDDKIYKILNSNP